MHAQFLSPLRINVRRGIGNGRAKKKKKEKELQRLLALPFALQCESGYKLSIYFEYIKEAYHYHYL